MTARAPDATTRINRQWRVGQPNDDPGGMSLTAGHFAYAEGPIPEPADGEVLIRAEYFSPDPMNHAWVRGMPGKFDPIPVGGAMRGGIAGRIVASRHPGWKAGEAVTGFLDWADYSLSNGNDHLGVALQRVPPGVPLASGLATLGMTGLCAWLGLTEIGRPRPGDTVAVSGASGGIGSIAGQIARIGGARVVGIAGGEAKCAAVHTLGFDVVADYRRDNLAGQLANLCPQGIDVFFDNVGGPLLDAALLNMAHGGRVVICGATAHYGAKPTPVFNHMQLAMRGLTMGGFFYFDHIDRCPEGRERLGRWLADGSIKELLDVAQGFAAVPEAALSQFTGGVTGRKLVRIIDDAD